MNTDSYKTVGAIVLIMTSLLAILSCAREMDESKTIVRNGILYAIGSDSPYTGAVNGKSMQEDYRSIPVVFRKEYKNGRLDGNCWFWYENGKIESVEPYKDGLRDGTVTRYYPNGRTKARIHFTAGIRGGGEGDVFLDPKGKTTTASIE